MPSTRARPVLRYAARRAFRRYARDGEWRARSQDLQSGGSVPESDTSGYPRAVPRGASASASIGDSATMPGSRPTASITPGCCRAANPRRGPCTLQARRVSSMCSRASSCSSASDAGREDGRARRLHRLSGRYRRRPSFPEPRPEQSLPPSSWSATGPQTMWLPIPISIWS